MIVDDMIEAVSECSFPDYVFKVWEDSRGAIYLQAEYEDPDTITGINTLQRTRRWFLSPEMTKSEIVSTVFKCVNTSLEHRCREWFLYRGKAVFGPHFDVDDLYAIADRVDTRENKEVIVHARYSFTKDPYVPAVPKQSLF